MDDKDNLRTLLSESDSDDGGITYRPRENGDRVDGLLTQMQRPKGPKIRQTTLILTACLTISVLLNVVFLIAIAFIQGGKESATTTTKCLVQTQATALPHAKDSETQDHSPAAVKLPSVVTRPLITATPCPELPPAPPCTPYPNLPPAPPCTSCPTLPPAPPCTPCPTLPPAQQQMTTQTPKVPEPQVVCRDCDIPVCGKPETVLAKERERQKSEKVQENIFADLTTREMAMVYTFLGHQPDLEVSQSNPSCKVYGIELHAPNKTQALLYLDTHAPKPPREARVVLACGHNRSEPLVYEYVVGPLPNPTYYGKNPRAKNHTVPYRFYPEYAILEAYHEMIREFGPDLDTILRDSYGAGATGCGDKCVIFLPQRTSSAYSERTVIVLSAYYATEFVTVNPLDFMVLLREVTKGSGQFAADGVYYNGEFHSSLPAFVYSYKANSLNKTHWDFPKPADGETSVTGSLNLRGQAFPEQPQAGPKQFDPEGKRYSIQGQSVQYLQWSFHTRMSSASGPQLWDVRWAGERIAYEISLQDVGVLYAGANPNFLYSHLSDSAFGLGSQATGLLPGLDCPDHATFLPQVIFNHNTGTSKLLPHAQCVFEHNTGRPLRRHRTNDHQNGKVHGGLVDRVLTVRSIIVEYNYDYIFDVLFHQNGAIELKTYATGYLMSQRYHQAQSLFGFRVNENIMGPIHQHIFNFKVDLDIQGESNRYETLDVGLDDRKWTWYKSELENFKQVSFQRTLKNTEGEATYRHDFSKPKYHLVYNDEKKNAFGNPRAYRIDVSGFVKQMLPDDHPALNSRRWAKYQMAATRRKDQEESSSSIYSMFDGENPHVNFDDYLQDNERIVDEDLVFWITVGMQHIPHTEDLPNTPTVGTEATIALLPYNYFRECPSVASRDSIRVEGQGEKVVAKDYGVASTFNCVPPAYDYRTLFSSTFTLYS